MAADSGVVVSVSRVLYFLLCALVRALKPNCGRSTPAPWGTFLCLCKEKYPKESTPYRSPRKISAVSCVPRPTGAPLLVTPLSMALLRQCSASAKGFTSTLNQTNPTSTPKKTKPLLSAEGRNLNNDVDYLNASSVGWAELVKPNIAPLAIRAGSITRLPVPIFDQYSPV